MEAEIMHEAEEIILKAVNEKIEKK